MSIVYPTLPFSNSELCFITGSYSAIENICSLNPGKGVGADDKNHQPLKCAHKDGIAGGCPLSWSRMLVKKNRHRNQKNGDRCVGEPPDTCSASDVFVNKQRLGG